MRQLFGLALVGIFLTACEEDVFLAPALAPPTNLVYTLEPSGTPDTPAAILLSWDASLDPDVEFYRIYSRGGGEVFQLRGETTSNTFHDNGIPHLEYYVAAVGAGEESDPSNVIRVDERLVLEAPTFLLSTSLNLAIHLTWGDNAFTTSPSAFREYRVYSTSYSLDDNLCGTPWALEGTTVAPEFLVGALANGVSRCFAVSAISVDGNESLWSPLRADTPRADARNVLIWAFDVTPGQSGFRFWTDANGDGRGAPGELGLVLDGSRADIDFWVFRSPADGSMWLTPRRIGTTVRRYANVPVEDLTSIDFAPETGYGRNAIRAQPRFGYVFQMDVGDGFFRYGAIRVTHVGRDFIIVDWSFQDDPGNPELHTTRGASTSR